MSAILVTGATGFVGSYITEELLVRGYRVVGLARSEKDSNAKTRVLDRIERIQASNGQRSFDRNALTVIEGDILKTRCGIVDREIKLLRSLQVSVIVHAAAETRFRENLDNPRIVATNVTGTRNVLELAQCLTVTDFCHISTAYVCGRRYQQVPESLLDMGEDDFSNLYEASKWEAEHIVEKECLEHDINRIILRPPIIVGNSKTGHTFLFNGYYTMVYPFWARPPERAMIPGDPEAPLSIVPVDFVVEATLGVIEAGEDRLGVFNLVPKRVHSIQWWLDQTAAFFHLGRLRISNAPEVVNDRQAQNFLRLMPAEYRAYLSFRINWDTDRFWQVARIEEPAVDSMFVGKILSFAVSEQFGLAKKRLTKN